MINFYGPINFLGYGVHTYNLMKAYSKLNSDISLTPPFGRVAWKDNLIKVWTENRLKMSKLDTGIMIFDAPFLNQFSGAFRIGFPVFETNKIDELSKTTMRNCDWLLTPSNWAKEVLKAGVNYAVDVVPEGFDPNIFYPKRGIEYKLHRLLKRDYITFVHVGKYEKRKGTLDIFDCFDKAFAGSEQKVLLKAHIQNFFDESWRDSSTRFLVDKGFISQGSRYFKKGNLSIELIIGSFSTFLEMASFYESGDFGIWLSKAEGWNLPLLECIACGIPALTTNVTGMTEYLGNYPSELKIENYEREIADDGKFYKGDKGEWYLPNQEEVISKLQSMAHNYEDYLRKSETCSKAVQDFTWGNAAKNLDRILKKLDKN